MKVGYFSIGKILIYIFLLAGFFFSAELAIYQRLLSILGIINSYLIDQLLFYFVLCILLIYGLVNKKITIGITEVLIFLLFLLLPFVTHSEILERYFYKEDFFFNLSALRIADTTNFYSKDSYFFVYPFLPIVLIYSFVKGAVYYYNFFTLIFLSISAFLLYLLNLLIIPLKNNCTKIISLLISIVYLTSPTYLDAYLWVSVSLEGGLTYSLMLLGAIFYILFLKKRDSFFFLLAFIVLLIILKTGFARAGFLPMVYILLEILFITRKNVMHLLMRVLLIVLPTLWLLFNASHLKSVSGPQGQVSLLENLYLLFAYIPHALFPFEVLTFLYSLFEKSPLSKIYLFEFNFYFTLGFLIVIFFLAWFFIIKDKIIARYGIVFTLAALICLFFFVNFGSLGKIENQEKFDKTLSTYSITIGHRYYQGVNILLNVSVFIILYLILLRYKKSIIPSIALLTIIIIYNTSVIKMHNQVFIRDYASYNKVIYEGMLNLIPSDNNRKIFFLTNGDKLKGLIYTDAHFLQAFYPGDTLVLVNQADEFQQEIKKGLYKSENIYAGYFDVEVLKFFNKTHEYRNKVLINQKKYE